jgi:hypothetical protein
MHHLKLPIAFLVAALFGALPLAAQKKRVSPHETISAVIDGNRVMIVYGRPYSKDPKSPDPSNPVIRKIWGTLVPYGQVWRTGSDEATLLITQNPIVVAGLAVPAGAYTLWTLPNADGTAKLIINKQIGQWGINPPDPKKAYDEALDVGRVDLQKDSLGKQVDEFTMAISKNPEGGGVIKMMWETTQYSVPFTVVKP